jgi:hypothetical protein
VSVVKAAGSGCTRCGTPIEDGDLRCCVCALPVPSASQAIDKARAQILRCTECGAAIAFDANKGAPSCAFCGATMTIEQPSDPIEVATRRIPFSVERSTAESQLRRWLGSRGFFAPKALRDEAVFESLKPLYWAAWIVDTQAAVSWTADSDAGSHRSDWAPHAGVVSMEFDNLVVPASRGLRLEECIALVSSYDVGRAVPVDAQRSAIDGDAVIESFDAQRSAARQQVTSAIESTAASRVTREIPGSRYRNLNVACLLERLTTDRMALPAWVLAYRYRGSPYRAVVHGQDEQLVFGSSPTDWMKVVLVVGGILAAIAVVIAVIVVVTAH